MVGTGIAMSGDLQRLEEWVGALLRQLSPTERRTLAREVGTELRRAHALLIRQQVEPDGRAFEPRKRRKKFTDKQGRIKRQKAAMFNGLRTSRWLKVQADATLASVGFTNKAARVARVHQEGRRDRVAPGGVEYDYPVRRLLGFSSADEGLVRDIVLRRLGGCNKS